MGESNMCLSYLFLVDYISLPESALHDQAVAAGILDGELKREELILALLDYDMNNRPGYTSHYYRSRGPFNWRNDLYGSVRKERIHDQFNFDFSQQRQRSHLKVVHLKKIAGRFKHLQRQLRENIQEEERAYFKECQRLRRNMASRLTRLERILEKEKEEKQGTAREENTKALTGKRRENELENEERVRLGLTFKEMDNLVARREDEQRLAQMDKLKLEDEEALLEASFERVEHI